MTAQDTTVSNTVRIIYLTCAVHKHEENIGLPAIASLPALGPGHPHPPAERGPSLESIYRVSLTVDLCEGNKIISLKKFISPQPVGAPRKEKKSGALGTCPVCPLVKTALPTYQTIIQSCTSAVSLHRRLRTLRSLPAFDASGLQHGTRRPQREFRNVKPVLPSGRSL